MEYDVFIIGGGINGAAIAADAAGRGLRVAICEQGDFAGATSSASSKLIHGGLRYLEQFAFKLVKESLQERNLLLTRAPHLVHPLEFIMPDNRTCHSPSLIRIGLFLYDHLAKNYFPASHRVELANSDYALKNADKGFTYFDCWGNDARLVIANLQLAQRKGAEILPRTRFVTAKSQPNGGWHIQVENISQGQHTIKAKIVINAAGPWADDVVKNIFPAGTVQPHLCLVKGSHLIVPRFYQGNKAFILQNDDGRIVFVIPHDEKFFVIGTTDIAYTGDPTDVKIDKDEIDYLCKVVNHYFQHQLTPDQVYRSYSGVRPLYSQHQGALSKISRESHIKLETIYPQSPWVTIYGGKLTTHRALAEKTVDKIRDYFPQIGTAWTKDEPLPGGEIACFEDFAKQLVAEYPAFPTSLCQRYARTYGTKSQVILQNKQSIADLGQHFGADLYEAEVRYLIKHEWVTTAADILWRRTKTGLYFTEEEVNRLQEWL